VVTAIPETEVKPIVAVKSFRLVSLEFNGEKLTKNLKFLIGSVARLDLFLSTNAIFS
jgi:hypothetical protein